MKACCVDTRKYRHQITVEQLTGSAGADGLVDEGNDDNWSTFHKCSAKLDSGGSREFFRAQQVHADITHLIEVLSSEKSRAITQDMRVRLNGRKLNITSARDVDELRVKVQIACVEPK